MASSESEITFEFPGHFKVYKDGRVEKPWAEMQRPVAPGLDPDTGVESKDVVISEETGVKARLFLPKIAAADGGRKLPLVVHYHGGGFCLYSPFIAAFKIFLSKLAAGAGVMVISVDYRLAPEHKLSAVYGDCFAALEWVARHADGQGPDPWLNEYADLGRVVLAGESAGANLAHYVAVQAGARGVAGVNLTRMLIVHPYFGNEKPDPYYRYMSDGTDGTRADPKHHPGSDPDLGKMKVGEVLVCVAEKDELRDRGVIYCDALRAIGHGGALEWYETKGEGHCFHFFNLGSQEIGPFTEKIVGFVKQG